MVGRCVHAGAADPGIGTLHAEHSCPTAGFCEFQTSHMSVHAVTAAPGLRVRVRRRYSYDFRPQSYYVLDTGRTKADAILTLVPPDDMRADHIDGNQYLIRIEDRFFFSSDLCVPCPSCCAGDAPRGAVFHPCCPGPTAGFWT